MAKYRKKPVVIEAYQWMGWRVGSVDKDIREFDPYGDRGEQRCSQCGKLLTTHGDIGTLEGHHIVCPGDYIITGVKGERYPCKPDIFDATYELVDD